ncbi:N-carbamoylputrescine amidase [Thermodesulfobium narugense DSM 14796]|uniref:N-carbamoylputrescine amidase n=1 Tax=Thermodesulfobium narugense DSM 14796 TaxID=747365 RepID=M1E8M5_9BACT|nr:carbon-nitrogen hydrolase [Thermodesulfobium narugense]AEE14564.1 N-carbamoylputrescine amidase [Thermodesulfobium narugense DSM 14796]
MNIKVCLVQKICNFTLDENILQSERIISQARENNADIIVFSELFLNRYFCISYDPKNFDLAFDDNSNVIKIFQNLARNNNIAIVFPYFEKRSQGIYHNSVILFDKNGSIAGKYRKMHIPDDPGYFEKYYFTPGDLGFEPITCSFGKIGILICWDQWFPEAARIMALKGAQMLIYPTAIGFDPNDSKLEQKKQLDSWLTIQRSHAIANSIPVISVNRVGLESNNKQKIRFWGNSFVCGPQGEFLERAKETEQILYVNVDLDQSERVRRLWPFFRDRRYNDYAEIIKCFVD